MHCAVAGVRNVKDEQKGRHDKKNVLIFSPTACGDVRRTRFAALSFFPRFLSGLACMSEMLLLSCSDRRKNIPNGSPEEEPCAFANLPCVISSLPTGFIYLFIFCCLRETFYLSVFVLPVVFHLSPLRLHLAFYPTFSLIPSICLLRRLLFFFLFFFPELAGCCLFWQASAQVSVGFACQRIIILTRVSICVWRRLLFISFFFYIYHYTHNICVCV